MVAGSHEVSLISTRPGPLAPCSVWWGCCTLQELLQTPEPAPSLFGTAASNPWSAADDQEAAAERWRKWHGDRCIIELGTVAQLHSCTMGPLQADPFHSVRHISSTQRMTTLKRDSDACEHKLS